jgi:hypothetical protein
MQRAA